MTITLRKLKEQLEKIKAMGFVKTHRAHDTGIGKTLEDLLGIKENNLRLPDVGDVELKAKRIDSGSMLTVATKSPEPKGINKALFEKYKYLDKEGKYNLHSTVYGSRKNPQSFKVVFEGEKLVLKNKSKIVAYWHISNKDIFASKAKFFAQLRDYKVCWYSYLLYEPIANDQTKIFF